MGSNFSTLAHTVSQLNVSNQTLIGVVLALPFFVTYFHESVDRYLGLQHDVLPFITKDKPVMKVITKSLLCGDIKHNVGGSASSKSMALGVSSLDRPTSSTTKKHKKVTFAIPNAEGTVVSDESSNSSGEKSTTTEQLPGDSKRSTGGRVKRDEYLEHVAQKLSKKAKNANHSDKLGISEALVQLGKALINEEKFSSGIEVLGRAEKIHKTIINETILSVASAMKKQGHYHREHGQEDLAKIYLDAAAELKMGPNATTLKKAWDVHGQNKPRHGKDEELNEVVKKVERRLKRASSEAVPLAHTLKLLAKAKRGDTRQKNTVRRSNYT